MTIETTAPSTPSAQPTTADQSAPQADSSFESDTPYSVMDTGSDLPEDKPSNKKPGGFLAESAKEKKERLKIEKEKMNDYLTEVMVDGRSMTVPVKELADAYQIRQMSHRRVTEADKKLKEYEAKIQKWKQNPDEFFDDPKTRDEWAQERVARMIQEMEMTPEQKEMEQYKRERAEFERQKSEQEKERMKSETMARQQSIVKTVAESLTGALKNSWLPNDADTLNEALKISYQASVQGTRLTPEELVQILETKELNRQKKLLSSTKVDKLAEFFPDHFEQVRKYQVERARSKSAIQPQAVNRPDDSLVSGKPKAPKYLNEAEYKNYLAKLRNNLRD